MASIHQEAFGQSFERHVVDADPTGGAGVAAPVGSEAIIDTGLAKWVKYDTGDTDWRRLDPSGAIADPGDGNAIPVTHSGYCAITTAGAETRTLAIPGFNVQHLTLCCDTYVGNCVITVASAFDQAGNTTITMNGAGDFVMLIAVSIGGTRAWRLVENNGCGLA